MNVGNVEARGDGWWTLAVWPADLNSLALALDPLCQFVVLEDHAAVGRKWRAVRVPLNESESGSVDDVQVRLVRMDLLMTPEQFRRDALKLQESSGGGGALIWQTTRKPPAGFRLSEKEGAARAAAVRGLDVRLIIDLPHDGELAVIAAASEQEARAAATRLGALA